MKYAVKPPWIGLIRLSTKKYTNNSGFEPTHPGQVARPAQDCENDAGQARRDTVSEGK